MTLRVPSSAGFLETLVGRVGASPTDAGGDVGVSGVDAAGLTDALDAMARGDIEYVSLEDGDAILQAAGDGDGPYQLEFMSGAGDPQPARRPIDAAVLHRTMLAFLQKQPDWQRGLFD